MTRPISRIIALTTCLLMGIFAAQAFADDYNHINSLARRIHSKAKVLLNETKHYRSTPSYVHMVRDVAELDQLACHLRDVAKNEGDLDHLASDIAEMDALFHHIEELFDTTELCAQTYGRGFIKGHTAHVKRLLNSIEDSIHHIGEDIAHLRATTPLFVQPAIVANPYNRYSTRPIVTRVETYRVPNQSVYRTPVHPSLNYRTPSYGSSSYRLPYGGSSRGSQLHHGHRSHADRDRYHHQSHLSRAQTSGFSIGGGSSRITFRF